MRGQRQARRGKWAFGLTATAFAWAVALVIAAMSLPVYSGSRSDGGTGGITTTTTTTTTLVGENGLGVLGVVVLPAVLTVLVWLALHRRCSRGSASSGWAAWGLVGLLWVFCLLAALSVGVFALPVALLLACAAALTPRGRSPDLHSVAV